MAIQNFSAVNYSTIWDVVLNTYGTVDQIVKLMQDNLFPNVNTYPKNGQVFQFDDTLVINSNQLQSNLSDGNFATRERTSTNDENMKYYEQTLSTEYKSNANGTTVITLPDLIGMRVISIEKEIQPIDPNWGWNPSSGVLTLLNGVTVDLNQTLYILYAAIITS